MQVGNGQAHSLFISDLHLCSTRPAITAQFVDFLSGLGADTEALYILGDLFEYWAGDDDLGDAQHAAIITALRQLAKRGTRVYFMHGNRDFLLAHQFAETCRLTLLDDPTLVELYGQRVLLSHGDLLCTDDTEYQQFRQQVRQADWQQHFLAQPLQQRKAQIEALRQRSEQEKAQKSAEIMDVNADAVAALLRTYDYPPLLIHGHTHRPARHVLSIDGHPCERWVLGDWYEQGSCLRLDAEGCHNIPL